MMVAAMIMGGLFVFAAGWVLGFDIGFQHGVDTTEELDKELYR